MAATERGVCHVHFGDSSSALADGLTREFPRATIVESGVEPGAVSALDASGESLSQSVAGSPGRTNPELDDWMAALQTHIDRGTPRPDLPIHVFATALQIRTWRFLTSIGDDETRNYSEVAAAIGSPKAVRAVANACAANRLATIRWRISRVNPNPPADRAAPGGPGTGS